MPDPKLKHSGYIDTGIDGHPYWAKCCCDWKGETRLTRDEAEVDLSKHLKDVA